MNIGQKIRLLREERQWSQEQLAMKMGYKSRSSINKIEMGINELPQSKIYAFAKIFGVNPSELLDGEPLDQGTSFTAPDLIIQIQRMFGNNARDMMNLIQTMNDDGQREVLNLIEQLVEVPRFQRNPVVPMRSIPVFDSPAAAGSPLYAESDFEYLDFPVSEVPEGTDFGIRILGESMQPTIEDGSIVWVENTVELHNGEIGVFMLNDSAVCKRLKLDDMGRVVALTSDNPEYDSIQGSDLEGFKVVGKVIL